MLRLSKMTDYGTVVLAALAREPETLHTAAELAEQTRLGLPTVSKLLKQLARGGLVRSTRGAHGGYSLARAPDAISAVEIIDAIEGPVALTECSEHAGNNCGLESICAVGSSWQRINFAIREALKAITLDTLCRADQSPPPEIRIDASRLFQSRASS